jgi:[ribosomal protein S18]-alanine N-acetyltransferase
MNLEWRPMTQSEAEEIASWKYPAPYDFYDMTADEEDYEQFIHPYKRSPHTYSVFEKGELMGFLTVEPSENHSVDLSFGMCPNRTGKGEGQMFLEQCLSFAAKEYEEDHFTLAVATFNKRAIAVYERAGFIRKHTFIQETNGGNYEFVAMEK